MYKCSLCDEFQSVQQLAATNVVYAATEEHGNIHTVKGFPYSITEHNVPELIPVVDSQPAHDGSQKPGGRLPLLSAGPAVTLAALKTAATNFAAW